MRKLAFGTTKDGKTAYKYILENQKGIEVVLSDMGALIQALLVPDKNGNKKDIMLGYDTLEEYYDNGCGFGAYVGRIANRIEGANVTIDGVNYQLEDNYNGHNLHSGSKKSFYELYDAVTGTSEEGEYVEFSRVSPHLEQGFPGNLNQKIRYTLTAAGELLIDYNAVSDQNTIYNPTNHAYFNLEGHEYKDVLDHEMEVYSDSFLISDQFIIPTGEVAKVEGTPYDFRRRKAVGKDINADYIMLKYAKGYDVNFNFPNDKKMRLMSKIWAPGSGIFMETHSDCCGMLIYNAGNLKDKKGKGGVVYQQHAGICFETGFYPNSCKEPSFPSCALPANTPFISRTMYRFGVE